MVQGGTPDSPKPGAFDPLSAEDVDGRFGRGVRDDWWIL